ncbi:hypothetical protein [Methanimicrococcus stummii]|uniref:hypothetical protein n=1 Tax=Methanimicrococcus stummii TaxID=3028294 RepID=UPI00292DD71D|nr:hypothetical protein [Methanimicrococcus sp. Es2]
MHEATCKNRKEETEQPHEPTNDQPHEEPNEPTDEQNNETPQLLPLPPLLPQIPKINQPPATAQLPQPEQTEQKNEVETMQTDFGNTIEIVREAAAPAATQARNFDAWAPVAEKALGMPEGQQLLGAAAGFMHKLGEAVGNGFSKGKNKNQEIDEYEDF